MKRQIVVVCERNRHPLAEMHETDAGTVVAFRHASATISGEEQRWVTYTDAAVTTERPLSEFTVKGEFEGFILQCGKCRRSYSVNMSLAVQNFIETGKATAVRPFGKSYPL